MKKIFPGATLCIFWCLITNAQNPISPAGLYIADPTARVWKDGRLYIYGSRDESPAYYCSWQHDLLSTADLKTWTVTKDVLASKGPTDRIPYSEGHLYAPDIMYKDGTYYLYYCLNDPEKVQGVATSKNPLGPFTNPQVIDLHGVNQIDPAVFLDDDGQAYYMWGQFAAKIAKLKPNMKEIDFSTFKDSIVTEKEHKFHEGSFMVKRNGIYYFIYAHMGRAGLPTSIGYATSKSPLGPFKYGGVIVDNDHCDPLNWNNHGSIVEFNKKWYVFYHRSTHGSNTMRKACIEPIKFNADGSIDEVEMTTQGAAEPLDALQQIDAERACLLYGNVRIEAFRQEDEMLTQINKGDKAAYKYIDFKEGADSVTFSVTPGLKGISSVEIVLDNSWAAPIGSLKVPAGGDGMSWYEMSVAIKKVKGVHAIWLRFNTEAQDTFKVNWFKFKKN